MAAPVRELYARVICTRAQAVRISKRWTRGKLSRIADHDPQFEVECSELGAEAVRRFNVRRAGDPLPGRPIVRNDIEHDELHLVTITWIPKEKKDA